MKKFILLFSAIAMMTLQNQAQTVTDKDGNVYNTVTIGTQVWFKENLKVTQYNDGTAIPLVTDTHTWEYHTTPGYCWYNNDATTNKNTCGGLYNWYAVNTGKLCPTGWHVPSDEEWTTMENYLIANGYNYDGTTTGNRYAKAMASATGWTTSTSKGAVGNADYPTYRNKSGFTAVPSGYRGNYALFIEIGYKSYLWSSTEYSPTIVWTRSIDFNNSGVFHYTNPKYYGYSVRCISGEANQINDIKNKFEIKIFPNPTNEKITIDGVALQNSNLSIYNIVGELILQKQLSNSKNEIDISNIPKGIYIIKIESAQGVILQKLIKE